MSDTISTTVHAGPVDPTTAASRAVGIAELVIPSTVDSPDATDFIEMVEVRNRIEAHILGSDALSCTARELLPVYQNQEFAPKRIFVARVDGRIVGRAVLDWSIAPGSNSSWLLAEVLAPFRGRGIGTALFDRVESLAATSGRQILQAEAMHTATAGGDRLPCPTGFGDLPMGDPGVRFLLRRGTGWNRSNASASSTSRSTRPAWTQFSAPHSRPPTMSARWFGGTIARRRSGSRICWCCAPG